MNLTKKEARRLAKLMLGIWVDEIGEDTDSDLAEWLLEIQPYVTSGERPPDELLPWTEREAYR